MAHQLTSLLVHSGISLFAISLLVLSSSVLVASSQYQAMGMMQMNASNHVIITTAAIAATSAIVPITHKIKSVSNDATVANIIQSSNIVLPDITITSPKTGAVVTWAKLTVYGTTKLGVGGNAIKSVAVKIGSGGSYQSATPRYFNDWSQWHMTFNMITALPIVGHYTITAKVTDTAGNQNFTQIVINYSLYDNFASQQYTLIPTTKSPNGKWYGLTNSGGSFGVSLINGKNAFLMRTPAAIGASTPTTASSNNPETYSALALSTQQFSDFNLSLGVETLRHTRVNAPANSWEVAWILFHYVDNTHFRYFVVKTDGAETGKYDGGVNPVDQKILLTAANPKAAMLQTMHWVIVAKGDHFIMSVNGVKVFDFQDSASYASGSIGLYCEDSSVAFKNVHILPL